MNQCRGLKVIKLASLLRTFPTLNCLFQSTKNIERLISSSTLQKRNVGKIFNKILAERYPPNMESISLDELLDWDMWKMFIKIYSKYIIAML